MAQQSHQHKDNMEATVAQRSHQHKDNMEAMVAQRSHQHKDNMEATVAQRSHQHKDNMEAMVAQDIDVVECIPHAKFSGAYILAGKSGGIRSCPCSI